MQILGPGLACSRFLGGAVHPARPVLDACAHIAYWTPMYGVAEIARCAADARAALVRRGQRRSAWFAIFVAGAAWRMSKDTARV